MRGRSRSTTRSSGAIPANLEQLENTNNIRFLRRRYKDPLAKDGQWKLLHYGDVQALAGVTGVGACRDSNKVRRADCRD